MIGRCTPLSPDDHRALGLELAVQRDGLELMTDWLAGQRLGQDHRAVLALAAAGHWLDAARAELDDMLWSCRLISGWSPLIYHPDDAQRSAWRSKRAQPPPPA